jgi:antirestriction protein ArdC
MPMLETFVDADSYYKTLFHELAHSTGHKSRLNRKSMTEIAHWGDNTYAKEELVAEISSWYLVGLLGLNPQDNEVNSQAYIKGWCRELSDKPSECVFAMQQATKVVDYLQQ